MKKVWAAIIAFLLAAVAVLLKFLSDKEVKGAVAEAKKPSKHEKAVKEKMDKGVEKVKERLTDLQETRAEVEKIQADEALTPEDKASALVALGNKNR